MMETRQRNSNFTGILLVLFVAWLLFGNGIQVVLLLTQQLQQRLAQQQQQPVVIAVPTASVVQPTQAASVNAAPLAPGQLQPLTLDGSSAPQEQPQQHAQQQVAIVPTQAPAPQVQPQPAQPTVPAPTRTPEPTQEPTGVPVLAQQNDTPLNARGEPDWNALAATAQPQRNITPTQPRPQPSEYTIASTTNTYGERVDCVQQDGQQVCQPPNIAMTDKDAQDILILLRAGAIKSEPAK